MSEFQHTPGPWQVIEGSNVYTAHGADSGDGIKADADDGWLIADCGSGLTYVDGELISLGYELVKANAKLIAAAPDLLEALEVLKDAFIVAVGATSPYAKEALRRPMAAIAKARGES